MIYFEASKTTITKSENMSYFHEHDIYEMYFQLDGERNYFCKNKIYRLQANMLITTKPSVPHKFEGGPYERILLRISRTMLSNLQMQFLDALDEQTVVQFSNTDFRVFLDVLYEILNIYNGIHTEKHLLIALKLGQLFNLLNESFSKQMVAELVTVDKDFKGKTTDIVLKIMQDIKENYNKPISLQALCEKYAISKTWLCKSFFLANKFTILQYKQSLQIQQACTLLKTSPLSIEKIAKIVGFSSTSFFIAVFKKNQGLSPLKFRRAHFKKRSS